MEPRLSLVTLGVTDLGRARAFYEALGWTTGAAPDDDVVFFQSGGMVLALWGRAQLTQDTAVPDSGGWGGVTLAHNVRSPEEVDSVLAEARRERRSRDRGRRPSGAGIRGCSSIPTAILGRSRTTRTGRLTTTGP